MSVRVCCFLQWVIFLSFESEFADERRKPASPPTTARSHIHTHLTTTTAREPLSLSNLFCSHCRSPTIVVVLYVRIPPFEGRPATTTKPTYPLALSRIVRAQLATRPHPSRLLWGKHVVLPIVVSPLTKYIIFKEGKISVVPALPTP